MGINTGPVVVGTIGAALRTDYTATGKTAGIASQLLGVAEPGQIVLTGRTRELATGRYNFGRLGEMPLPGALETVDIYTLTRETPGYVESTRLATV